MTLNIRHIWQLFIYDHHSGVSQIKRVVASLGYINRVIREKKNLKVLWILNAKFSHSGAQRAAILDKRLTQASSRRAPVYEVMAPADKYEGSYSD